jgi:hypothetical protein
MKIAYENSPGFQAQIVVSRLKRCILGENPQNRASKKQTGW